MEKFSSSNEYMKAQREPKPASETNVSYPENGHNFLTKHVGPIQRQI